MHNTWLELSEPIEELEANVAVDDESDGIEDEPEMYVNLAGDEEVDDDVEEGDVDDDVAMARALAAMGLGSLNL